MINGAFALENHIESTPQFDIKVNNFRVLTLITNPLHKVNSFRILKSHRFSSRIRKNPTRHTLNNHQNLKQSTIEGIHPTPGSRGTTHI